MEGNGRSHKAYHVAAWRTQTRRGPRQPYHSIASIEIYSAQSPVQLMSYAASGYGVVLGDRQTNDAGTQDSLGRGTTSSLMGRTVPFPQASTSSQALIPQPSQSALPASVPATVACWATPFCDSILNDFAYCYNLTGTLTSPNADGGQSELYQRCLCHDLGTTYKDILAHWRERKTDNLTQCYACMRQAGVEIDRNSSPSSQMRWKINGFCNTAVPNLYDVLTLFLVWLTSTDEPVENNAQLGRIPSITSLAARFTSTSGVNQPTRTTASSLPQSIETTSSGSDIPNEAIPTPYLHQLPKNWPYTTYAAAKKAHQTTSFLLTSPNASSGETVAWVLHEMLWNPRPLFTPLSARGGGLYQPWLKDWVPEVLGRDGGGETVDMATTRDGEATTTGQGINGVGPGATPALDAAMSSVASTMMVTTDVAPSVSTACTSTSSTTSLFVPLPSPSSSLPLPTSTSPPTPPPVTSQVTLPVRPPYHQSSLFGKLPDPGDPMTVPTAPVAHVQ